MRHFLASLAAALIVAAPAPAAAQRVIHVDTDATGANDGTSWADAFVFLQDALAVAQDGDEVWVAEGVYRPDQGAGITAGDREAYFDLPGGAAILGGFAGFESSSSERSDTGRETILSGDILGNDPIGVVPHPDSAAYADNAWRILYSYKATAPRHVTRLDGLTIRGAFGPRSNSFSVAVKVLAGSCELRDVRIIENMGRHAAFLGGNSSGRCDLIGLVVARNNVYAGDDAALYVVAPALISDSLFEQNLGVFRGGALFVAGKDTVSVVNSLFLGNQSPDGGAIYSTTGATVIVISSRFISNVASCSGGAVEADTNSKIVAVNSLFASNRALADCAAYRGGGAVFVYQGEFEAINSTFASNSSGTEGDVIGLREGAASLYNSILSSNGSGASSDLGLDLSQIEVGWLLADEPLPPTGMEVGPVLQGDAAFVNPAGPDHTLGTLDDNYALTAASPAIEAGDNAHVPRDYVDLDGDGDRQEATPLDLAGNPRVVSAGQGAPRVDLGALEASGSTSIGPGWADPSRRDECGLEVFPNPFRNRLSIRGPSVTAFGVEVFDALGRRIERRTSFGVLGERGVDLSWDGWNWPPGLYLLRISGVASTCSRPVIRQ